MANHEERMCLFYARKVIYKRLFENNRVTRARKSLLRYRPALVDFLAGQSTDDSSPAQWAN